MSESMKAVIRTSIAGDAAATAKSLAKEEATKQDGGGSSSTGSANAEHKDHPDGYTGFHEDDCHDIVAEGEKPPSKETETLLNPALEKAVAKDPETKSWLSAGGGIVFQGALCLLLICIGIYEVLLKKKAKVVSKLPDYDEFDFNSIIIWNAVFSIILGAGLAFANKTDGQLFGPDFFKMLLIFFPPGLIFGSCAALQFMILDYLPADVFKVLEQMRLLVVALVSRFMLGKRQTWLSWICLVVICFCCFIYCFISQTSAVATTHADLLHFALNATHGSKYNVTLKGHKGLSGALFPKDVVVNGVTDEAKLLALLGGVEKTRALSQIGLKEELTKEMHKLVKEVKGLGDGGDNNYAMGLLLTFIFITLMCLAGVYCEKMMKDYNDTPFYIQKVFMEIPTVAFGICNSAFIGPALVNAGMQKPSKATPFIQNPFAGWNSIFLVLCFILFMAKSWLSGIIVKMLSSLAKQLCSIVTVVACYFFIQIHFCNFEPHTPKTMWCPEGIYNTSAHVAIADFAVMLAVMTYVMSQNQSRQLAALQEAADKK